MLKDDLRCIAAIVAKDLRAYYFKPPNISWGLLFPFAFLLAFTLRNPGSPEDLVPGLLALTLLFGTTSMEAIVITFERRIGALERLELAPMRLPALLAGKLLGGVVFGLVATFVTLAIAAVALEVETVNWEWLLPMAFLSATAFAALGILVSVAVKEVFEAQTLANAFRFPMMFLGGVFVPVTAFPAALKVLARLMPLTYSVEGLRAALGQGRLDVALMDIAVLLAFTAVLFALSVQVLARRTV
ncbi:MAG: ABC transporter permease [Anaerolineae bacterium]|nr:ABC transporter permease [Anaerolineae bacterium]